MVQSSVYIVDSVRVTRENILISGFLLNLMVAGSYPCFWFIYIAICISCTWLVSEIFSDFMSSLLG